MLSLGFGLLAACAWAVNDLPVRKLAQSAAVLAAGMVALLIPALVMGGWQTMGRAAMVPANAAGVAYVAGSGGLYQALGRASVRIVAPVLGSFPILSLGIA